MTTVKGLICYANLITPKENRDSKELRYSLVMMFPPHDSEGAKVQALYNEIVRTNCPNGLTGKMHSCWQPYDQAFQAYESYDRRMSGWMSLSMNAKVEDKPELVQPDLTPLMDRSWVASGSICWVSFNMGYYSKGTGGIGAWIQGVMGTGELGPFGRMDGKPTVEQMFANVPAGAQAPVTATWQQAPAPSAPPSPMLAPPPAPAPSAPMYVMTAAAQGFSREQYLAQGWTDTQLVQQGMMMPPAVTPSFL